MRKSAITALVLAAIATVAVLGYLAISMSNAVYHWLFTSNIAYRWLFT